MNIDLGKFKDETHDPLGLMSAIVALRNKIDEMYVRLAEVICNEEDLKEENKKYKETRNHICEVEHDIKCLLVAIEILRELDKPLQLI